MADKKEDPKVAEQNKSAEKAGGAESAAQDTQGAKGSQSKSAVSIQDGLGGYLGVKAGVTQIYDGDGNQIGVTVIDLPENFVTDIRTEEKNGYKAVQVGFLENKKKKNIKKPQMGQAKKAGGSSYYNVQEFRLPATAKMEGLEVAAQLSPEFVKEGDLIDLTAVSKGKGFQGVMKRYNFAGGPASHGASIVHRMPGSINVGRTPSRVVKGKKMAGHMGNKRVTVQNVRVARLDLENRLLLVHGSVPGPRSGLVRIRKAVKQIADQGFGAGGAK